MVLRFECLVLTCCIDIAAPLSYLWYNHQADGSRETEEQETAQFSAFGVRQRDNDVDYTSYDSQTYLYNDIPHLDTSSI
jgi:hypothetical protein